MGRRELGNAETAFRKWEESLLWARIPWKKWSSHHNQQNSLKCSTWMQSQKWQNDLYSFPRQTIQYHSNPNLCPKQKCWRSWSWMVLLRPTRPSRTNTQKRCPFHYRGLECKSRSQEIPGVTEKFCLRVQNEAGQKLTDFAKRTLWS